MRSLLLFSLLALVTPWNLIAIQFRYNYNQGDQFRFLSRVYQQHGFTDQVMQQSELINRMSFKVEEVKEGRGRLTGSQQSSQRVSQGQTSVWDKEYPIDFWRDPQGIYEVGTGLFVPMVRNVPYFPVGRELGLGEKWFGRGEEVHDMRDQIGYSQPFRIPISVEYEYVGPRTQNGKPYHLIRARYKYNQSIPQAFIMNMSQRDSAYPTKLRGSFEQDIYWDQEVGQPGFYKEKYEMTLDFSNRRTYTFKGEAEAHLIEAKPMDKEDVVNDLKQQLAANGFADAQVKHDKKGVTFSIDNILFVADSAQILPGQDEKLEKIGNILSNYRDRDIALVGHTAQIGADPNEGQALSERRAKSIADVFVQKGFKKVENIIVEGRGGRDPLAENNSEDGRSKNRRVEITILEN